jgi:ribosomal protein S18 acetylase RimI-like enzyme
MEHLHTWTSRLYETEHDLVQMQEMLMEARSRTSDWRYWHVGELMWQFFMVLCHLSPQEHIRLWHDGEGKLAGYAILGEDPWFDWQVLPEYEWCGIETEALAWADACLARLREREGRRWAGPLICGARQDNEWRRSFLEQQGFRHGEHGEHDEVNMIRSLDEEIPEPMIPTGFQVRGLDLSEVPGRAAVEREVWGAWTVGNISDDDYARLMRLPGYHRDLDVVAVTPEGVIVSAVNGWIDPVNRIGDFGPVGASPAYRRRGLTRAALLEGMLRMKARGMDRMSISTQVTNTASRPLYESIGFQIVNSYFEYVRSE